MILVSGCRHPEEDHLYWEEELEMMQKGVLHDVHTAYSRLPGQPKVSTPSKRTARLCPGLLPALPLPRPSPHRGHETTPGGCWAEY